ncbi:RidA family protein [Psychromonas sp. KJ10-2]|uniref:RidA family protein n=1 Tax=Psychromonas sp. KJ10-2 TaxID=3391822 RepID=UPI0039B5694E
MSITYHQSNPRMSELVVHGNTIYSAGQVANDYQANMTSQTQQILSNIENLLATVGATKEHILSVQIWVSDMSEFSQLNKVWDEWVTPGHQPARACVECKLANPDWKVEMMFIAGIPTN